MFDVSKNFIEVIYSYSSFVGPDLLKFLLVMMLVTAALTFLNMKKKQ
jgi:hypothetical protein